ncbi:MAG: class I SAM-dependent methyltransferase [Candidatus Muirbacterium halophilum]|nr:class I SAM-dependent methyltransferase [Candidatus Muirbacterium halophilum]MCK9476907.1 class I SAM-dependent methyltransferase [Candidatus Muirbacterium halophilum]
MINKFPDYYDLLLNEIYNDKIINKHIEKKICLKMDKFRKTLQHRNGYDVNYSEEQSFLYTMYFWPVNFFKFYYFLEILDEKTDLFDREKISIGDIGCGTGGFFTALIYFLNVKHKKVKIDYTGFDMSTENLKYFRKYFFSKDFKKFINNPLKFNTYSGDFLEIKKFPKKDLVIVSNVYSELSEENRDIFWKKLSVYLKKDEQSYIIINEPVNRKNNERFHVACRGFLFENNDFSELAPNNFENQHDNSAISDYFETVQFKTPSIWEKLWLKKDDADFVYRILSNRKVTKSVKAKDLKDILVKDEFIKFNAALMTKDIYRKPKPPWRFKITDGINDINMSDVLVDNEEHYLKLTESRIGDIFEFSGKVIREKGKKLKSKFAIEVQKIVKLR